MPSAAPFDHLVVTAANAGQADGYRLQLHRRRQAGRFGAAAVHVVTDPGDRRVGSGGSTLAVLAYLLRQLGTAGSVEAAFAGRRILILHAGGDGKRLPAYAALGKLFVPLPCAAADGGPAAFFDLLLDNLLRIPAPPAGQLLVASGDVLLTFDATEVDLGRPGVTGVAFADLPDRAERHGVYVTDGSGQVVDFLQKPSRDQLATEEALDALGRALIDTGLMSFDPAAVAALCAAAGIRLANGRVMHDAGLLADLASGAAAELDLYEEVALALARRVTADVYAQRVLALPRNRDPAQHERLRRLYAALRPLAFQCCVLSYCDFFHIGSSRELLAGLSGRTRTSACYGFRNGSCSVLPDAFPADRAFAFNTVVEAEPVEWGEATVVEACHVRSPLALARRNVVTGLPAEATHPVELPEGVGLTMLPIGPGRWAAVAYGLDDDFRRAPDDPACTLFGRPLRDVLANHRLADDDLGPERLASLYDGKLWPVGSANDVLAATAWLLAPTGSAEEAARWRALSRRSLAELVRHADHARMLEHRADLQRLAALHRPLARLAAEPDLDAAALSDNVRTPAEAARLIDDLAGGVANGAGLRARALILAQLVRQRAAHLGTDAVAAERIDAACRALAGDGGTAALWRAASAAVAAAVAAHVPLPGGPPRAAIEPDQVVWATAPARLDFAGGWSDTPPICTDRGGAVVNAAVTLNGQYPIQAIAKLSENPVITLTSIDLGRRVVIDRIEHLAADADPDQWDALPRACLALSGFTAAPPSGDLRELMQGFGGGIDLTVFSALPKGSGLGASSILGATVLAALARLTGRPLPPERLVERTLLLEQHMTTGGGWQDQVGGIFPGVKLVRTAPGPEQTPSLAWLAFDPAVAKAHMLLYFTGMKRLAKNILQNVVHRYLARDPRQLAIIDELKAGACELREAIDTRNLDGFGRGVLRYWELKKRIDPGATTPVIEKLIARVAADCIGYGLLGAGGGGFLLMVTRDEAAGRRVRAELTARPATPGARFFDFAIDEQGLKVCVL